MVKTHIAKAGQTWDFLAVLYFGDETKADAIIEANRDYCHLVIFEGGEAIVIPDIETILTVSSMPPWER